jgi:flagellum-specific ATP synthase
MAELIRLGAYHRGSDPAVDEAIHYYPEIEKFLDQRKHEKTDLPTCYRELAQILGMPSGQPGDPVPVPAPAPAAPAARAGRPVPKPLVASQNPPASIPAAAGSNLPPLQVGTPRQVN